MSLVACQSGNLELSLSYHNKVKTALGNNLSKDYARCLYEVGKFFGQSGKLKESEMFLRKSIDVFKDVNFYIGLSACLILLKKFSEAESALKIAITMEPENPGALVNMSTVLKNQGKLSEAEIFAEKILSKKNSDKKNLCDAFNILYQIREEQGHLEEAEQLARKAIAIKTDNTDSWLNLGSVLYKQERLEEAENAFREALAISQDNPEGLWGLSLTLLLSGRYIEGWSYHDSRFYLKENSNALRFDHSCMWNGEDISGKRILVWSEQGYGDQIQTFRYLKKIWEVGGEILVETNTELVSLFRNSPWPSQVIQNGEAIPDFDFHIPFMSLPRILFEEVDFFSQAIPYLQAHEEKLEHWRNVLSAIPGYRVGIVWAGSPVHKNDRNRSINLERMAPLASIPGISLISLQKGSGESQVADCHFPITNFGSKIQDFEDTAAILKHLDLLISVDTSVVHLAGALGQPVWTLLPTAPDWRWMLDREDSPWYPSMRLFRQPHHGDWDSVIQRIVEELKTNFS